MNYENIFTILQKIKGQKIITWNTGHGKEGNFDMYNEHITNTNKYIIKRHWNNSEYISIIVRRITDEIDPILKIPIKNISGYFVSKDGIKKLSVEEIAECNETDYITGNHLGKEPAIEYE